MRLLKLLVVLALCLSLSIVVVAHPGGTDSDGGHTDHSTGEYHYHHGYSAHQHYDQDGDGLLDCPYNFVDTTVSSADSGSSYFEEKVAELEKKQIESTYPSVEPEPKKVNKTLQAFKDYLLPIACCFALYAVIMLIEELKWRFRK